MSNITPTARYVKQRQRYNIDLSKYNEQIRALAESENRTYANMILTLIKEALDARKIKTK